MVVVTPMPNFSKISRRERRLWVLLSEWLCRRGCPWVDLANAKDVQVRASDKVVGLVVIRSAEDLEDAATFRDRFPHGQLVAVGMVYDPNLLVALHKFSPCFVALNEGDDAAVPEILESLGRTAWMGCGG